MTRQLAVAALSGLWAVACGGGNPHGVGHDSETCNGVAVDVSSDPANCGTCGYQCSGQLPGCCNATCTDFATDYSNCGVCGNECGPGDACLQGSCGSSNGATLCSGTPVDTTSDPNNCGSCGYQCSGQQPGCCNGQCTDLATDFSNCSGCGEACLSGETCIVGTCRVFCGSGLYSDEPCVTSCGGAYVEPNDDPKNCGSCGYQCGGVVPGCCSGTCTDFSTDYSNCNYCGNVCGAGQSCVAGGASQGGECIDCATQGTTCNGACVDVTSDPNNCGACGTVCGGVRPGCCYGGCTDLSTDSSNCATCGNSCEGTACVNNACQ